MSSFVPTLANAVDAKLRMNALCGFTEFWLGPRKSEHAELGSPTQMGVFGR
jgi:hypothetical protein